MIAAEPVLLIESRGAIEIATLNRPDALNSFNPALVVALTDYFEALHGRPEIRVVVLRGAGRAFCAGLDVKADWRRGNLEGVQLRLDVQRRIARVIRLMRSCPQPIISLGHGAACGGGFSLMLASDVRYAAPSLRMNAAYIKLGLGGCDIGSSYLLPRLVGSSIASELLLTGRFINADRCLKIGLVSDVIGEEGLLGAGLELAAEMLATAPLGLRLTKDALNLNIDAQGLEAAMAIEDRQQVLLGGTEDYEEAKRAFLEKRLPIYRDL